MFTGKRNSAFAINEVCNTGSINFAKWLYLPVRIQKKKTKNVSRQNAGVRHWWRRRESNPRPQVIRFRLYMLIRPINLINGYPVGRENQKRSWISFNGSTPGVLHRDPV